MAGQPEASVTLIARHYQYEACGNAAVKPQLPCLPVVDLAEELLGSPMQLDDCTRCAPRVVACRRSPVSIVVELVEALPDDRPTQLSTRPSEEATC